MSGVRLTRRGRLLLHTLPIFVILATGIEVLTHRVAARGADPPPATTAASMPVVTPSPTPRPVPLPSPTPVPTPTPTPTPKPARPAYAATGALRIAPGSSAVHGNGPLRRFTVEVEAGLPDDPAAVAAAVERTLFDPRGWAATRSFQRVSSGPVAFRVTLASPATTDRLCRPLDTGGIYSCYASGRSVLNAMRWHEGAATYSGDLASYRVYMVNHEVGHALGYGHRRTCGAGGLAYVMIQQTKSLYGCRRNPWPLPAER